MHSFPQFARSALWGEFPWMGAIIFGENFIVRGQFSGGQLSSGEIIVEGHCPGSNYPGSNHPGDNSPGGNFPRGQLSGHRLRLGISHFCQHNFQNSIHDHYVKSIQKRIFSGPNTGNYRPEKTPYLDTFHAVDTLNIIRWCPNDIKTTIQYHLHCFNSSNERLTLLNKLKFIDSQTWKQSDS